MSIDKFPMVDQYEEDEFDQIETPNDQYLSNLLWLSGYAMLYFVSIIVTYLIIVHFCLLVRWLRTSYGGRFKPNGRKAIIITGATSGFGLAAAKRLYKLGYTVFACYYNDQESGYAELLELKLRPFELCKQHGSNREQRKPELFLIRMDIRSVESIEESGKEISQLLEVHNLELHTLINNAGTSRDGPYEFSSRSSIADMIQTNLTGTMLVSRQFMLEICRNKARIVNVSSGVYSFPAQVISVYGSTKCAVAYFSDALNEDLKPYGATCCTLVPGNFFAASNIIYTKVRYLQESVDQLSPAEQVVYKDKIEDFSDCIYRLLKLKIEASSETPAQIASTWRIKIPNFDELPPRRRHRLSFMTSLLASLIKRMDGSTSEYTTSLDKTGVVEAFEDAVRLKDPPRRIYAGNWYWYHISGPMTEYLPPIVTRTMGNIMVEGINRP